MFNCYSSSECESIGDSGTPNSPHESDDDTTPSEFTQVLLEIFNYLPGVELKTMCDNYKL